VKVWTKVLRRADMKEETMVQLTVITMEMMKDQKMVSKMVEWTDPWWVQWKVSMKEQRRVLMSEILMVMTMVRSRVPLMVDTKAVMMDFQMVPLLETSKAQKMER